MVTVTVSHFSWNFWKGAEMSNASSPILISSQSQSSDYDDVVEVPPSPKPLPRSPHRKATGRKSHSASSTARQSVELSPTSSLLGIRGSTYSTLAGQRAAERMMGSQSRSQSQSQSQSHRNLVEVLSVASGTDSDEDSIILPSTAVTAVTGKRRRSASGRKRHSAAARRSSQASSASMDEEERDSDDDHVSSLPITPITPIAPNSRLAINTHSLRPIHPPGPSKRSRAKSNHHQRLPHQTYQPEEAKFRPQNPSTTTTTTQGARADQDRPMLRPIAANSAFSALLEGEAARKKSKPLPVVSTPKPTATSTRTPKTRTPKPRTPKTPANRLRLKGSVYHTPDRRQSTGKKGGRMQEPPTTPRHLNSHLRSMTLRRLVLAPRMPEDETSSPNANAAFQPKEVKRVVGLLADKTAQPLDAIHAVRYVLDRMGRIPREEVWGKLIEMIAKGATTEGAIVSSRRGRGSGGSGNTGGGRDSDPSSPLRGGRRQGKGVDTYFLSTAKDVLKSPPRISLGSPLMDKTRGTLGSEERVLVQARALETLRAIVRTSFSSGAPTSVWAPTSIQAVLDPLEALQSGGPSSVEARRGLTGTFQALVCLLEADAMDARSSGRVLDELCANGPGGLRGVASTLVRACFALVAHPSDHHPQMEDALFTLLQLLFASMEERDEHDGIDDVHDVTFDCWTRLMDASAPAPGQDVDASYTRPWRLMQHMINALPGLALAILDRSIQRVLTANGTRPLVPQPLKDDDVAWDLAEAPPSYAKLVRLILRLTPPSLQDQQASGRSSATPRRISPRSSSRTGNDRSSPALEEQILFFHHLWMYAQAITVAWHPETIHDELGKDGVASHVPPTRAFLQDRWSSLGVVHPPTRIRLFLLDRLLQA